MSITWNCLGDSITSNIYIPKHYYTYIQDQYENLIVRNYGICGTKIAGNGSGAFCKRYEGMLPADIITVFGGVNDWGHHIPTPLGTFESQDETTFYGALHALCKGLKTKFQTSTIIFFTPIGNDGYPGFAVNHNQLGYTVKDYVDAILNVCEVYDIPVVDLYRDCGFSPYDEMQRQIYFMDGLHLSCEGHKKISQLFLYAIRKYYGDLSETTNEKQEHKVDLMLFMGQSNMAGRGITNELHTEGVPEAIEGAGFEFRAISNPNRLYPLQEPFGVYENNEEGIYEPGKKTGSLVTSFINEFYAKTKTPVVGISASKGGTSILEWQPQGEYMEDTKKRLKLAKEYLVKEGYLIQNIYMVWCQGETDADHHMENEDYKRYFEAMLSEMLRQGVEECFLITIGQFNGEEHDYSYMIEYQKKEIRQNPNVVLVSTKFDTMLEQGLMKDQYHYFQAAYNLVGQDAGKNAAYYCMQGMEPDVE